MQMETIIRFFENLFTISDAEFITFFFKAFAVVFSILFVVYAIIMTRQTKVLTTTLETQSNSFIVLISNVQLVVSIFILLLAIFFI